MFRLANLLLPVLVTCIVALAACLPWGAPAPVQFALPLLTMAVIFYWAVKRRHQLPSPVVFLIGLFTDLATAGPLGYWALNFLIAVAIASYCTDRIDSRRGLAATIVMFALAVVAVSIIGWLLSSLFQMRAVPAQSLVQGALTAVMAYPVIAYILGPIDRLVSYSGRAASLRGVDRT